MKVFKRSLIFILSLTILLLSSSVLAKEAQYEKTEVVYTKLLLDGSPSKTIVVNSFQGDLAQGFSDYGEYTKTLDLEDGQALKLKGQRLDLKKDQSTYYYRGELEKKLPWEFKFTYYLDAKEVKAKDLAGKTGKMAINLQIKPRSGFTDFTKAFVLQTSLELPDSVKILQSETATIARSGAKKLVTLMTLPGKEANLKLEFEAQDFEMPAIQIAALSLNMPLDLKEITAQFSQLVQVEEAISKLASNGPKIVKGARDLAQAYGQLDQGLIAFNQASQEIAGGLETIVSSQDQLSTGTIQALKGFSTLAGGIGEFETKLSPFFESAQKIDGARSGLSSGFKKLSDGIGQLAQETKAFDSLDPTAFTKIKAASNELGGALNQLAESMTASQALV